MLEEIIYKTTNTDLQSVVDTDVLNATDLFICWEPGIYGWNEVEL